MKSLGSGTLARTMMPAVARRASLKRLQTEAISRIESAAFHQASTPLRPAKD